MNCFRHAMIKYLEFITVKRICLGNGYDRKKKGGPKGPPRMVQSIRSDYNRPTSEAPRWKGKQACLNVNLQLLKIPVPYFGNHQYFPLKFFSQFSMICLESLWRILVIIMKEWSALWCGPPNFFGVGEIVFQPLALFIAQHATATCCRRCIQKWHGI